MSDTYTYERIMSRIDPEVVSEKISNRYWMARETFPLKSNKVKNYDELIEVLTRYVQHHYCEVGLSEDCPDEYAYGQAVDAMRNQNISINHVYDDCIRGTNGGVKKILDLIAAQFEQEQVNNYIEHVLSTEIDQMDYEQIEGLMTAFVQKFGGYLPYHLRSTTALVANWKTILLQTANMHSRLRSYVGKL